MKPSLHNYVTVAFGENKSTFHCSRFLIADFSQYNLHHVDHFIIIWSLPNSVNHLGFFTSIGKSFHPDSQSTGQLPNPDPHGLKQNLFNVNCFLFCITPTSAVGSKYWDSHLLHLVHIKKGKSIKQWKHSIVLTFYYFSVISYVYLIILVVKFKRTLSTLYIFICLYFIMMASTK